MGFTDVPPAGTPSWVIPASTACLAVGFAFWSVSYLLTTLRSLRTQSYGMPLFALAVNVSWEAVFALYLPDTALETSIFGLVLLLDAGLVYTTLAYGRREWAHAPWVAERIGPLLGAMTAAGLLGNWAFVQWWLSVPGRGTGDKTGKFWRGQEGFDVTELAWWSGLVLQVVNSTSSLAMLVVRQHSGGVGFSIWFYRFAGSVIGLFPCSGLLWWYWPEAHGYFVEPLSLFLCSVFLVCDIIYPFVLYSVRTSEKILPDGRVVRGSSAPVDKDRKAS